MYYEARINARVDEKWDFEGTLTVYPPAGVREMTYAEAEAMVREILSMADDVYILSLQRGGPFED
jgi:hypothetical protein